MYYTVICGDTETRHLNLAAAVRQARQQHIETGDLTIVTDEHARVMWASNRHNVDV